jgi:hypothetical protein
VGKKALKGRAGEIVVHDAHVKVDACGGQEAIAAVIAAARWWRRQADAHRDAQRPEASVGHTVVRLGFDKHFHTTQTDRSGRVGVQTNDAEHEVDTDSDRDSAGLGPSPCADVSPRRYLSDG